MLVIKNQLQFIFSFLILLYVSYPSKSSPRVTLKTEAGNITVVLDTVNAPITAKNFLKLVKEGTLSKSCFYRTVRLENQPLNKIKIEVIQGGIYIDSLIEKLPVIAHETTAQSGILHKDGAISMARNQPGTASTEFFICIGDQPELDFGGKRNQDGQGFAAFGKVISGMEIVRVIQQLPDSLQYLTKPVLIKEVIVEK